MSRSSKSKVNGAATTSPVAGKRIREARKAAGVNGTRARITHEEMMAHTGEDAMAVDAVRRRRPTRSSLMALAALVLFLCVVRFGFRIWRFYGTSAGGVASAPFNGEL